MKKLLILVLTNFFILTLILLGKPAKAQTTEITGQFLYGLELYVLPEKETNPDYTHAIYNATITDTDFLTSGLYQNWLQPYLPSGINGYVYIVDSSHTINNVRLGGGYLDQGQVLPFSYEPYIDMKHYNIEYNLIDRFRLNPINNILFTASGGNLEYISYYENNDGTTPRIKLIDATTNINDYNRVKEAINGYDVGYQNGYTIGYENGQNNGYDNGYEDGQNNGYSAGYNAGQYDFYNEYYQQIYNEGYNAGLGDRQLGVNTVVDFNQLIKNGNFNDTSNWSYHYQPTIFQANENILTIYCNGYNHADIRQTNIPFNIGDKYIFIYTIKGVSRYYNCQVIADGFNKTFNLTGEWITDYNIFTCNSLSFTGIQFYFGASGTYTDGVFALKNVMLVNLTQIYGLGNEPTTKEEFLSDFPSQYYDYTLSTYYSIDYENGYNTGYDDGYPVGYDDGKSYQATQQLTSDGWIKNIFTGIGSFLALEILPGVSIGLIVGIPFIITVAWFVLKMARGGSSE